MSRWARWRDRFQRARWRLQRLFARDRGECSFHCVRSTGADGEPIFFMLSKRREVDTKADREHNVESDQDSD